METPLTIAENAEHDACRWIPWSIVGFFVFFVALLSGFAYIAIHSYTGEVTENAYQKGLTYNREMARASEEASLGWHADWHMVPRGNTIELALDLTDSAGHPVTDAQIMARCLRPTQAGHDVTLPLSESPAGVYRAVASLPWRGLWHVRISATKDGKNYQQSRDAVLP